MFRILRDQTTTKAVSALSSQKQIALGMVLAIGWTVVAVVPAKQQTKIEYFWFFASVSTTKYNKVQNLAVLSYRHMMHLKRDISLIVRHSTVYKKIFFDGAVMVMPNEKFTLSTFTKSTTKYCFCLCGFRSF